MDLVPLSKIGTHLLASSDIMVNNRNSLACLRNACSYFAVTYCTDRQKRSISTTQNKQAGLSSRQYKQAFSRPENVLGWRRQPGHCASPLSSGCVGLPPIATRKRRPRQNGPKHPAADWLRVRASALVMRVRPFVSSVRRSLHPPPTRPSPSALSLSSLTRSYTNPLAKPPPQAPTPTEDSHGSCQ